MTKSDFAARAAVALMLASNVSAVRAEPKALFKEVTVDAPLSKVWQAWTTKEGVETFFAKRATIDLNVGGAYELLFALDYPEGKRGCEGCRILAFVPREMLCFTWNAPPSIPTLRDANASTQVAIYFDEVDTDKTRVRLSQTGLGEGEDWDRYYAYFDRAWSNVLQSLKDHVATVSESPTARDAPRVQRFVTVVDAPVQRVWNAFTVKEEIEKWMVPKAEVDLRPGGTMRTNYNAAATPNDDGWIVHSFLAVDPLRMLAMRVTQCPAGFPFEAAVKGTWAVVRFEPAPPDRTRVSLAGVGYRHDEASQRAWDFFEQGNAWTLEQLGKRFAPPTPDNEPTAGAESDRD